MKKLLLLLIYSSLLFEHDMCNVTGINCVIQGIEDQLNPLAMAKIAFETKFFVVGSNFLETY